MPSKKTPKPKEPTERVFLIDSFSHIFRAFFAPMGARTEPLTNSRGQITQAVFVFTNMLRKLLADERPHYIAAVFESGVPTFRHEMHAGYKANRVAPPEELETQIPYIVRVCEAYNVPILNVPGFEADDVIGTLAVQAAEAGLQAVIVSNDKDMTQLVRDPWVVCMRNNSQNVKRKEPVPPVEWCDEAWVENRFGVKPTQIVDLLGLMGDTDVNIKLDLDKLRCKAPDRASAYKLFRELEFQSLTREFSDAASEVDMGAAVKVYAQVRKVSELEALTRKLWDVDHWAFALADSTPAGAGQQTSVREGQPPTGIAISYAPNTAHFINFEDFEGGREQAVSMLRDVLSNGLLSKSVHDLKRAHALLANAGVELEGVGDDTLLAAYLLDPVRSRYELGDLAREAVNSEGWTEPPGDGWTPEHWRAAETADLTAQVADVLHGRVLEQGLFPIYDEIELPLAPL